MASTSFLLLTNPASEKILGAAYINKKIKKISPYKSAQKLTGSSLVATEESIGNAVYTADSLESKQKCVEVEYRDRPCAAVSQRITPFMSKVHLRVRANIRGV